ncbi:MAG: tetratricopeptide repeat protein [Planctomycetaceae bacterium]
MHGLLLSLMCLCALVTGCNRTSGFLHNDLGQRAFQKGNHAEAARHFRMAATDAPQNANYAHNLGVAMLKQGQPAQAEQLFRHALDIEPMHQPSYHSLASLMKDQNRHPEIIEMLTEWSETQPYLAEPQIELAWMNRETGNYAQAEQNLRQALKVEPSNATALAHLGQVYDDQGRSSEAVAMYRRSLYQDWNQHDVKGRVATLTGQPTRHPYASRQQQAQRRVPQFSAAPVYSLSQPVAAVQPQFVQPQVNVAARGWTGTVPQQAPQMTRLPPIPEQQLESPEFESGSPASSSVQADQRLSFAMPLVEAH